MKHAMIEHVTGRVLNIVEVEPGNVCLKYSEGHPSLSCLKWHPGPGVYVRPSKIASPGDRWVDGRLYCPQGDGEILDQGGARMHLCQRPPALSRREELRLKAQSGTLTPAEVEEALRMLL